MATLALVFGWIVAIFIGALSLVVIILILIGKIDLTHLLSDENGKASLSRLQLLIFTMVIALGLFLIIVSRVPPGFPDIPTGILLLLGLSGASFVTSKAIDAYAMKTPSARLAVTRAETAATRAETAVKAAEAAAEQARSNAERARST